MTPNELRLIQLEAFIAATEPTQSKSWDSFYRGVCRWYSREFSTPLETVTSMSEADVLTHYYEDFYGNLASSDGENAQKAIIDIRDHLINITKHETETQQEMQEEDDWVEQMNEQAKAEWGQNAPNLMKEETFSAEGEDESWHDDFDEE
jgi:hypothetical protein